MGLEPTPGPWQGPVLPLYYGRPDQRNSNTPAIQRQDTREGRFHQTSLDTPIRPALPCRASVAKRETAESADLQDPRGLHYGGFSLPLSKLGSFLAVCVNTREPLPVLVKHGDLPVLVLPPAIFPEFGTFPCGFGFGHSLNISIAGSKRKYQLGQ
jgi:hypothetical protein